MTVRLASEVFGEPLYTQSEAAAIAGVTRAAIGFAIDTDILTPVRTDTDGTSTLTELLISKSALDKYMDRRNRPRATRRTVNPVSDARRDTVLAAVRKSGPSTVASIAVALGIPVQSARSALKVLVKDRALKTEANPAPSPGRPQLLYSVRE